VFGWGRLRANGNNSVLCSYRTIRSTMFKKCAAHRRAELSLSVGLLLSSA